MQGFRVFGAKLEDMLARIVEKVRRRCPHVFAGEACKTPEEAAAIWQREKAKEKAQSIEKSNHVSRKRNTIAILPPKQNKKPKV